MLPGTTSDSARIHWVRLAGFWTDATEVTDAQIAALVAVGQYAPNPFGLFDVAVGVWVE